MQKAFTIEANLRLIRNTKFAFHSCTFHKNESKQTRQTVLCLPRLEDFQAKNSGGGTSMGVAIVQTIVEIIVQALASNLLSAMLNALVAMLG
jgi:hypothetical protein